MTPPLPAPPCLSPSASCPPVALQGSKVLDDPKLLAKSLKRLQKSKAKSGEAWAQRTATQTTESAQRTAQRNENLQKKRQRGVNEMHQIKDGGKGGSGGHKGGKPHGSGAPSAATDRFKGKSSGGGGKPSGGSGGGKKAGPGFK